MGWCEISADNEGPALSLLGTIFAWHSSLLHAGTRLLLSRAQERAFPWRNAEKSERPLPRAGCRRPLAPCAQLARRRPAWPPPFPISSFSLQPSSSEAP